MSEKLLPIVAGCRAILIRSYAKKIGQINNIEVLVVKPATIGLPHWEIENSEILEKVKKKGFNSACAHEKHLMRIDGGEFEHEKEEQEMKL